MSRWDTGELKEPPRGAAPSALWEYIHMLQAFVDERLGRETDADYVLRHCGTLMDLTPCQVTLFAQVHRARPGGLTLKRLCDLLYAHRPAGGPENVREVVKVQMGRLRAGLARHIERIGQGWYIPPQAGGGEGFYMADLLTAKELRALQAKRNERIAA